MYVYKYTQTRTSRRYIIIINIFFSNLTTDYLHNSLVFGKTCHRRLSTYINIVFAIRNLSDQSIRITIVKSDGGCFPLNENASNLFTLFGKSHTFRRTKNIEKKKTWKKPYSVIGLEGIRFCGTNLGTNERL